MIRVKHADDADKFLYQCHPDAALSGTVFYFDYLADFSYY